MGSRSVRGLTAALAALLLAPAAGFAATLTPASFDFGGQSMGTTSPAQAFTFTNNSGAAITVGAITVGAQFAQTHNCPASLAASASCTINVTFKPAVAAGALNSTVAVAGTLSVTSSGAGSPNTATLAGTAEKSLVTHYYRSILRRAPDTAGKAFWEGEATRMANLGANVNEVWYAMAQAFYFSTEYAAFNRNSTAFLTDLYVTFFNRQPDTGGLNFWLPQLNSGLPREVALASFMFSPEFTSITQAIFGNTAARAEVDMAGDFYRGLLSRLPDDAGFNFWVQQFRTAQCQGATAVSAQAEAISSQFATGTEYAARARTNAQYVGDLYNAFLRRGGDQAGVNFWITALGAGTYTREQVRQQFVASTEFKARVTAVVNQGCLGKIYYLSPTGNDAANGTTPGTAWKTWAKMWGVVKAADTVLVADGTYTNVSPPAGKAGAANQPIIVQAQNPGGAKFDAIGFRGNSYINLIGFRIQGDEVAVDVGSNGTGKQSHHLVFQQIGFSCTPGMLNDGACFGLGDGTHHVLLEDSWGFGGGRYTIMCYGGPGGSPPNLTCDFNTFRRVVIRMGPSRSSGGNPQASLSLYYAANNIVENVIAIDGQANSDSSNAAFYMTGHEPPPNASGNKYYGVIALNNMGMGWYLDCPGAVCDTAEVRNSVFWKHTGIGVSVAGGTGPGDSCNYVIVDHNTIGFNTDTGYDNYACMGTNLTNNAFYKNTGAGAHQSPSGGSTTVNHHNGYFGNTVTARSGISAGTGDLTSDPALKYIARIETTSPYKNAGSPGDIGANVVNRYQDGVLTAVPLWPWPFEARLRAEMCATSTGAFCTSGKSLTKYIWEYLGNTSPF